MAPLVLTKPSGDTLPLISLTPLIGIARAEQKIDLLTDDTLSITLEANEALPVDIGDTIAVFGQLYTLNTAPAYRRDGTHEFTYELVFEGPQYHLLRVIYFDVDLTGNALSSTFSLTGNLSLFVTVLISNMARVFSGAWGLGDVTVPSESTIDGLPGGTINGDQTDIKTLTFENENCLTVLQRLCAEYGTEFWIEYQPNDAPNRVLHIGPAGQTLSDRYMYGQSTGLYELSRRSVSQTPFYTKAYIFGGSKNIPSGYRGYAARLQLPLTGSPTGPFSPWDSFVSNPDAITTYGLIEGTQVFEDVYPTRTGTISASTAQLSFSDDNINFNPLATDGTVTVNGKTTPNYLYLLPGLTPKVHFQTGNLAGYEFDIAGFDVATLSFTLKPYTDERGLEFPGKASDSPFRIAAGDTYVLVDMKMPQEYITAAEEKLQVVGEAWLRENGAPVVEYGLTIDEMYLQKRANDTGPAPLATPPNFFTIGDAIRLIDVELGIDRMARITSFTRDALKPYKYSVTLGDTRKISEVQRARAQQVKVKNLIQAGGLNDPNLSPQTVPKNEVPSKTELAESIKDQIRPLAHGVTYTLFATPMPAGFTALVQNRLLARHSLSVTVNAPSDDLIKAVIGRVTATGIKRAIL